MTPRNAAASGSLAGLKLVPVADQKRMSWKNGGGVTTEIAAFPTGASLETFEWRVSTALVASDGPFSQFPGTDRTLVVLDGSGLLMTVERDNPVHLTSASAPFAFNADRPTDAKCIDGPVTDLNVMTKRQGWRHTVERVDLISGRRFAFASEAPAWVAYCHSGAVQVPATAASHRLSPGDAIIGSVIRADFAAEASGTLYLIEFHRV